MTVFTLNTTMQDAYGRTTRKLFKTEDISGADIGAEYLAAQGFATTLLTALGNISEAQILYYNLGREVVYTDTFDAGANVDEGMTALARKTNNKLTVIKVPAPINAIFNADGTLDITDAIVTSYTNHFIAGNGFTISDGENILVLVSGRLDK